MLVETLAPAEDGGEKTEATGRGQQVHHGCLKKQNTVRLKPSSLFFFFLAAPFFL